MGRKDLGEYGEVDHRDMSLTLPRRVRVGGAWEENPAYYAGYPDRFVVLDAGVKVHQVLYRGRKRPSYTRTSTGSSPAWGWKQTTPPLPTLSGRIFASRAGG
ncbi:hypothetical protein [Thermus antranikianii]|uniref:hypothetical protein n=1 Tax=Thermus antranikianii TaxID=88190 RepID=UPI001C745BF7|nr:hypothetical protein [Thermus antranikianii]QWK23119.1 MAG: hypothetical protein KNN15_06740 [Thermus antranikianii]